MIRDDRNIVTEMPHSLILEGRERLSIHGVTDVLSFDENAIYTDTVKGALTIFGEELHIEKLSLENGEVIIEGFIDDLRYESAPKKSGGIFSKLFG